MSKEFDLVIASGCFSAITSNHVNYLRECSGLTSRLVLLLPKQKTIEQQLKPGRCCLSDGDRRNMLRALAVCYQIQFHQGAGLAYILRRYGNSARNSGWRWAWIKGGDYTVGQLSATEEGRAVLECGGVIRTTARFPGEATTEILNHGGR